MTASTAQVAKPAGDGAAADPAAGRGRGTLYLLEVGAVDRITDDAVAITFVVPDDLREVFEYLPGQHVAIRATVAGDDVRRNYSICAPAGSGVLRIGVKRLPDGVFSGFALDRLQVGDCLEVLPPTGRFTTELAPDRTRHYGAIAAGSGITPVLSIIASALQVEPLSTATLVYVNRNTESIMFLEELEDLKNQYLDRLTVLHVLDGERQEVELLSGRLDAERLTTILDQLVYPAVDEWFLCGPIGMTDMARQTLLQRGIPDGHIRRELFHVDSAPARRPTVSTVPAAPTQSPPIARQAGHRVTVMLNGRSTSFTMAPNTDTILDAALAVRSDVPFACTNGVCGTCRCALVSGTVEMMQNFALEQDEVDRGYRLACQSFPVSDDVVVDFDR